MAHNLNFRNGTASVMTHGPAWHGLGNNVSEAQTSESAIILSQLDYKIEKEPCFTKDNIQIPDRYVTVRKDTNEPLGIVGNRYHILPNEKAFEFIDKMVGSKEAVFETAGALGRGERVFLTCKLPNRLVVGKDDVADNYFFLTNSHDGSTAIQMMFTQVFVVCANTVREALRTGKRKQRVKHTATMESKMFDAASLMGITWEKIQGMQKLYNSFTRVNISDDNLRKFIEMAMYPGKEQISEEEYSTRFKNTVDQIYEYALTDTAQLIPERRGTLWGAYNSITGYYNNLKQYDSPQDKLKTIMFGGGNDKSVRALEIATEALTNQFLLS